MTDIPVRIRIRQEGAEQTESAIDDLAGSGGGGGGVSGLASAFAGLTGGGGGAAGAAGAVGAAGGATGAGAAVAGPVGIAIAAIGTGLVTAIGAAVAAFNVIMPIIRDFGNELERQAGIMANTEGSVDAASEAVGGLISRIDLMTERNRMMQAGLRTTDEDFAAIAERAVAFAQATGSDASGAITQLSDALRTLSAEGLQRFGVEIDSSGSRTARLEQALSQLRDRAAETETGAVSLGGAFQQLSTFVDDAMTTLNQMIESSDGLNEQFHALGEAIAGLAENFGIDLTQPMEIVIRLFAVLLGTVEETVRRMAVFARAWDTFSEAVSRGEFLDAAQAFETMLSMSLDWSDAFENIIVRARDTLADYREDLENMPAPPEATTITGGGGGGAARTPTDLERLLSARDAAVIRGDVEEVDRLAALIARHLEASSESAATAAFLMDQMSADTELQAVMAENTRISEEARVRRAEELAAIGRDIDRISEVGEVRRLEARARELELQLQQNTLEEETALRQFDNEERLAELHERRLEIQHELLEVAREIGASTYSMVGDEERIVQHVEALNDQLSRTRTRTVNVTRSVDAFLGTFEDGASNLQGLWSQFWTIIDKGGEDMEEQLVRILDAWLTQFAIQEGFEAAKEFVMAIAAAAQYDYSGAAQHAAAGAGHLALAIAAGGAAAAIPNPGAAGGGAGAAERPEPSGEVQPRNIVINITGQSLLTEAEVGRSVRRALEAEQRRF